VRDHVPMSNNFDEMTERMLDDAGIQPGMRVLDIGCGPGGSELRTDDLEVLGFSAKDRRYKLPHLLWIVPLGREGSCRHLCFATTRPAAHRVRGSESARRPHVSISSS
jgi:hypothetical protein